MCLVGSAAGMLHAAWSPGQPFDRLQVHRDFADGVHLHRRAGVPAGGVVAVRQQLREDAHHLVRVRANQGPCNRMTNYRRSGRCADTHSCRGEARAAECATVSCAGTSLGAWTASILAAHRHKCEKHQQSWQSDGRGSRPSHPASAAAAAHRRPGAPRLRPVSPGRTQRRCRRSLSELVRSTRSGA